MSDKLQALLARPHVAALLAAFRDSGSEARLVGGAVRDAIMGREPGDIDLATPMLPDAVMALARGKGWKAVPTGIDHGTVTLVLDGHPYEVTTLRRDVATDGRRAVVSFTMDWREDAFRRDFTLNALYLSSDRTVHDHGGGVNDARAGRIRFMGDPETRIREDYLRILRFFRFLASHGAGEPDEAALDACAALKAGLSGISRERVRQELLKLLVAPGVMPAAAAMEVIDLWPQVLAGVEVHVAALVHWTMFAEAIPGSEDPMSALFALSAPNATPATLAKRLKLSRAETERLELFYREQEMIERHLSGEGRGREAVYRAGPEALPSMVRAWAAALGRTPEDAHRAMAAAAPALADPPRLPFSGADLAALGVQPGPHMGRILRAAEEEWVGRGLPEDPATCVDILRRAAADTA